MISYQEALQVISQHQLTLNTTRVPIEQANGHVLAQDLIADRDFPPFDRVTMDGIAINFADYEKGQRSFPVADVIGAGMPQKNLDIPGQCVQIMTGAIMPTGLDTVIRYEDIEIEDDVATIKEEGIRHRQNIHFKGQDKKAGEAVVAKGTRLSPVELIVAASIGQSEIPVLELPKAAIITTGDELVNIHESPLEHQIRRSSNYGVQALLKEWNVDATQFHLKDDKELMIRELTSILSTHQLIILTGGVSRGKFDYLPEVLEELGVEKHFHKVKQRPGKPFWFGTRNKQNIVFALPGNPVSSFACANVYLRHWLQLSQGMEATNSYAELGQDLSFPPELTWFVECQLEHLENGKVRATAFRGNGSGDFANLTLADGFLILPEKQETFKAGEVYPYIRYRKEV
ncbi:molybdopterin molybdotransferase MoeA [Roseivirga sp.]|uniref:molybdopterin molybdotransferase MoeA n=1 Tax=Roseivirga sp. TaxID=1964215 RepID=UPI003B52056B